VLRHNHQLDHYGETAAGTKDIKSEPNELALAAAAAVVAAAVDGARELADPKPVGVGRTAVGSATTSVTATSVDRTIDSVGLLHGVSSTTTSSSSLSDVISRHRHHHQQAADTQQTTGSCSFTVSNLVHPTTGSSSTGGGGGGGGGGFASAVDAGLQGRDVSVDGVLNNVEPVVDSDSFDPSTAAAAAAQWFAAAGGHHQATQYATGYSSRYTPEFYMQRLHASIAADRRHSVVACIGLADADSDGTVPPSTPAFGPHVAGDGYSGTAAWYCGVAQSSDVVGSPTAASSGAYVGGGGLHDVFDVSAATRMLSTRQSCAQLQSASPFRAYYGASGPVIAPGPSSYVPYAEDCASGKY